MSQYFEELDHQVTPLGPVTLSRRRMPLLGDEPVFEIKLNDEFLMSSAYFGSEVALASLGLKAVREPGPLNVVVGGLGLGFTAKEALRDDRVGQLAVIEFLEPVIDWHRRGLVPLGRELNEDPRCRFVHQDFFARARHPSEGMDPENPSLLFDAVLLDIDHSPTHYLNPTHAGFYEYAGLERFAQKLTAGGVFALWSNDPPEDAFLRRLREVFPVVASHVVSFPNPLRDEEARCSVYVAVKG